MSNEKVYVCLTAYHVYVTLVKILINNDNSTEIILFDTIPSGEIYANRIKNTGLFLKVHYIKHTDLLPIWCKSKFIFVYLASYLYLDKMNKILNFMLNKNVYLYSDNSDIGVYLMRKKKMYHVLEDGCNTFRGNKFYTNGKVGKIKSFLYTQFGIPYAMAQSDYCIDLEVNDISIVKTPVKCQLIEENRHQMVEKLTKNQKKVIANIFDTKIETAGDRKKLLLLTQPLIEMRIAKTNDEVFEKYSGVISEYINDYDIFVKPHPRDNTDYSKLNNGKVAVIDRTIPIEVLKFHEGISFDLAVALTSTSIYGVEFCKEIREVNI